jgi:hypothetical protein
MNHNKMQYAFEVGNCLEEASGVDHECLMDEKAHDFQSKNELFKTATWAKQEC